MTPWRSLTLVVLTLLTSRCTSGPTLSQKPTSIQDVINSKMGHLYDYTSFVQDPAATPHPEENPYQPSPKENTALVVTGRDYSGGGGGGYGGGGGGYGGSMAYSSNYDTALTALAFLSFGVFLLNLLLMAMNRTTTGRRRRDTSEGDVNSLIEMVELLHETISNSLFDAPLPECALSRLCATKKRYSENGAVRLAETFLTPFASQGLRYVFGNDSPIPSLLSAFNEDQCNIYREDCLQLLRPLDAEAQLYDPDKWKGKFDNQNIDSSAKRNSQFRQRRSAIMDETDWESTWDSLQLLLNFAARHVR